MPPPTDEFGASTNPWGRTPARVIRVAGPASPYDPSYALLTRIGRVTQILERERPDVLEIHSPYLAALAALRADPATFGLRTFQWHSDFIDTYAGVAAARVSEGFPVFDPKRWAQAFTLATKPAWSLVRTIASRCDATLVAARWQEKKLTDHGVSRVHRIPFGVERHVFSPLATSEEGRQELLHLAQLSATPEVRARVLVGVGRFAIEKRWDIVIDAFLKLRERNVCADRPLRLVLIGDGPERGRMEKQASSAPDIVMPGFIHDRPRLARLLANADALVHACPFETFGLSIAEASSAGLPHVVPDQGGAAEMHAAEAGERYASLDANACSRAIERLLARLDTHSTEMRRAAVQAVAHLPTVHEQFARQITLYRVLIEAKRTASQSV